MHVKWVGINEEDKFNKDAAMARSGGLVRIYHVQERYLSGFIVGQWIKNHLEAIYTYSNP